jgi:hypothetical protein
LFDKHLASLLHGGQLELFLGAEMRKEAALAHAKLFGERANGEAFEALHGSDIHGAGEDGFAGAHAAGLSAGHDFLARGGRCGLQHGETITQRNK